MMGPMKLEVLPSTQPWYAGGLKFTCTQCGNCCTGGPGFVWISDEEIARLAAFLQLSAQQVRERYCRKIGSRWSLKEHKTPEGKFDCIFLSDQPLAASKKRELRPGQPIPLRRRGCAIYPARPLQCRTWPFWDTNLSDKQMWDFASRKCPGMNRGGQTFSAEQIEALRDASDWPENPPTSARH